MCFVVAGLLSDIFGAVHKSIAGAGGKPAGGAAGGGGGGAAPH